MLGKRTRTATSDGFTLTDTIVTVVLFSLLIPLATGALIFIAKLNHSTSVNQEVTLAINKKANTLQTAPFASTSPGTYTFTSELSSAIPSPRNASYTVTERIGNPDIKDIVIVIQYTKNGVSETKQYKTSIGAEAW